MNIIWELSINDIDGTEFSFPLETDRNFFLNTVEQYIVEGKQVEQNWKIPLILKKEVKHNYDFFHIEEIDDAVCITQRMYDILYPLIKNDAEFLPLQSDEGVYYLLNVTNIVDCIDREKSICTLTPNGLVLDYEDLVFDTEKIKDLYIFRVPDFPYQVFLTENLKTEIEDFEEVSFTEEELVFDGILYLINNK
jgi:hypothetical protein